MISIPISDDNPSLTSWQSISRGLPRAYAILFFSSDLRLGWALLVISLLAPDVGLFGIAGVIAAGGLAANLGFDRARIRNGYYLFNPLLVCLTIGWMNRAYAFPWPMLFMLWIAAVLGGFFMAVALQQWFGQQFALSPQSLPATSVADTFLGPSLLKYDHSFLVSGEEPQVHACLSPSNSQRTPAAAVQCMTTAIVPRFCVDHIEARLVNGKHLAVELLEPTREGMTDVPLRLLREDNTRLQAMTV